jgi:hypothetical protein
VALRQLENVMRRTAAVVLGVLLIGGAACGGGGDDAADGASTPGTGGSETTAPATSASDAARALAPLLQDQAIVGGAAITYTDAQCYAELLVLVLGEEEARQAVEVSTDAALDALGEYGDALAGQADPETNEELAEVLEPMSRFCRTHLRVDRALGIEEEGVGVFG